MGGAHRGMVLAAVQWNFQRHSHQRSHRPPPIDRTRSSALNLVTSFYRG